jgi:type I restriction enzyme S subunit
MSEQLPDGWAQAALGDIAKWGSGGTPSRINPSYYGGGIPWVKTGDLGPKKLSVASEFITAEGLQNSSAKIFPKGSVAIAMYGATIGKTSILDIDASTNQACAVAIPLQGIDRVFTYYLLNNEKENFIKKGKGGAQPNISQEILKAHLIQLPPLNEQIRIADKLDSVLAKVDAAQTRLEKIPTLLKRFRQAVLAAATSGELTREWRIEKLFTEWSSVLLKDICNSISDGDHQAPPQTESGVPFLVISNVSIGTLDLSKVTRYVPIEYYEGLKSFRKPALNDILYTVTGSFGIPVIVNTTEDFCFQRHIAIIKPRHDKINYKFLTLVLGAPEILRHANEVATGTAQKTVSLNNLRKFEIPMPSEDEQKEIVRRVESLFTLADTVEKQYLETKKRIDRLTQSLLAKAFRGELVPQDPNDEPAAELLKRIQAERNAQPPVKNKRKQQA